MSAFNDFASREKIKLGDSEFSDDDLEKARRIFYRSGVGRAFAIDINRDPERGHEALVFRTGENYDVDMLTVFVPPGGEKYEQIWELYVDWIVLSKTEEEISSLLDGFDDGNYGVPEE